jgi:hypothetical protein
MVNKCRSLRTSEPVRSYCHRGAVTAQAGSTVTLYCGITQGALTGGFDTIEITYEGGKPPIITNAPQLTVPPKPTGLVSAELIELSKATGAEAPFKCGIEPTASATIATARMLCTDSHLDLTLIFTTCASS